MTNLPEGQPVPSAHLAEHRNLTPFPSQYFQNVDTLDRVFHIVVTKVTYDLATTASGEVLRLAEVQAPLTGGDEHYGEPATSSVRRESDFVPYKPRCDVVLANACAWAPGGRAERRWQAGMAIEDHRSVVQVTGPRRLKLGLTGLSVTQPEKARQVALRYEAAFGGSNMLYAPADLRRLKRGEIKREELEPQYQEHCPANPVGCGYGSGKYFHKSGERDWPAPQLEVVGKRYLGQRDYPVVGLGVLGRHWTPRIGLAGTYNQSWKDERWPLLPVDFDFAYWNGAQFQIPYPQGGEAVVLLHLTEDGDRRWRLPKQSVFTLIRLQRGLRITKPALLDTLVFDLSAMRLTMSYRVCVPASVGVRVMETRLRARHG